MASEPIPEPLTNQRVDDEREPHLLPPRIADNAEAMNAVQRQRTDGQGNPEMASGLNRVAETVGGVVGNLVTRARELSDESENAVIGWKEATKNKLDEVKRQSAQALDAVQQSASINLAQAKQQVSESVETARLNASHKLWQARIRARNLACDHPLQIIAASAALGFIAGVLLRVWRSSRYE